MTTPDPAVAVAVSPTGQALVPKKWVRPLIASSVSIPFLVALALLFVPPGMEVKVLQAGNVLQGLALTLLGASAGLRK